MDIVAALPDRPDDTLANRLIEARLHRGLSRSQFALRLGYPGARVTLWRYETGRIEAARAHEDVVFRFADELGCNAGWLMYSRGEPQYDPDWRL